MGLCDSLYKKTSSVTPVSLSPAVTSSYIYMAAKEMVHEYDQGAELRVLSVFLRECVGECARRLIRNAAGCMYLAGLHDPLALATAICTRTGSFTPSSAG